MCARFNLNSIIKLKMKWIRILSYSFDITRKSTKLRSIARIFLIKRICIKTCDCFYVCSHNCVSLKTLGQNWNRNRLDNFTWNISFDLRFSYLRFWSVLFKLNILINRYFDFCRRHCQVVSFSMVPILNQCSVMLK